MAEETRAAREAVVAARAALSAEVDELGAAARSAVDIPAKIRRDPLRTLGLAGGLGFLALGGPKRFVRAVERRLFPSRAERVKGILPSDIEKAIGSLGDDAARVRAQVEREFEGFLKKRAPQAKKEAEKLVGARQSFWKTYDAIIVPASALAAKRFLDKLFAADRDRRRSDQPADEGRTNPTTRP